MVVYGDLLFLINFSMDLLSFYIACLLLHMRLPLWRAVLSSAIGGAYSVASLFLRVGGAAALAIDLGVLFIMCLITFSYKGIAVRQRVLSLVVYLLVSVLLGGMMTAMFSLFNRLELVAADMGIGEGIDAWIFILLAGVASALTVRGGRFVRSSSSARQVTLRISTELGSVSLRALADSGDLVREPISGRSVAFVPIELCGSVLSPELYTALSSGADLSEMPLSASAAIRLIPSRGVGGGALLPAIRFGNVTAIYEGRAKRLDIYVAFVRERSFGEYEAIVPQHVLD